MSTFKSFTFRKQVFRLFLFFIAANISLFSCQKRDALKSDTNLAAEAKTWFSTNVLAEENRMLAKPFSELPQLAPKRVTARMNKLSKKLDWSNATTYSTDQLDYVIVPLQKDIQKLKDNSYIKRVFVFYKKNKGPMKMQVIELLTKDQPVVNPVETASLFFEKKTIGNFLSVQKQNIQVFFYNEKYYSLDAYEAKEGHLQPLRASRSNKPANSQQTTESDGAQGDCVEWVVFWVTYDGDGNIIYSELIYTYWVGNCPANGDDTGDNSDMSGGGGGGGGTGSVECSMSCETAQAALNSWTTNTFSNGGFSSGAETGPDANGIIRKPVVIEGDGVVNNYPFGYSEKHALFFTGVIYKTTTNSQWKCESLKYTEIKSVYGSPGPCLSSNVTAIVSGPIISSDKLSATYSASVTTSVTIPCALGVKFGTNTAPLGNTYAASQYQ